MSNYDFGGWATKYNVACSDGRTISNNAFRHCDDVQVPLVWNHTYTGPESVIGNVTLKHQDDGVYAYGKFNQNATAVTAKNLVLHGDITALSIYANKLKQQGGYVLHGDIKEVSLVLAGANPGASIQEVLVHGDADETAATIYNDEVGLYLYHEDTHEPEEGLTHKDEESEEDLTHKDGEPETVADVYDTLTDKQKTAVAMIIEQLAEDQEPNNEGEEEMKHNVFDQNKEGNTQAQEIKHSEFLAVSMTDAKKHGSLKESLLAHSEAYGITDIGTLFPEAKNITNEPIFIDRDQSWVGPFLSGIKKSPFSRLKALYADITADEARALGYIKGNLKKEEVFGLLKRTTSPTTIYKKQKLDRDDIIDITDFNVVNWMKNEMRGKLNEELARAVLIGDGRSSASDDKINESNIRPVFNDSDLYCIKTDIGPTKNDAELAKAFIIACIKSRSEYEGNGTPNLYTTDALLADMLLLEDNNGRFIYESQDALAKTLRVAKIIPVPVMRNLVRQVSDDKTHNVKGIILNPNDYTLGADKGGEVTMFDDFDIDYNQEKYLIETRCSGSLLKPKTAITIEQVV